MDILRKLWHNSLYGNEMFQNCIFTGKGKQFWNIFFLSEKYIDLIYTLIYTKNVKVLDNVIEEGDGHDNSKSI